MAGRGSTFVPRSSAPGTGGLWKTRRGHVPRTGIADLERKHPKCGYNWSAPSSRTNFDQDVCRGREPHRVKIGAGRLLFVPPSLRPFVPLRLVRSMTVEVLIGHPEPPGRVTHAEQAAPFPDGCIQPRWASIKRFFTHHYLAGGGTELPVTESPRRQRGRGVWQPRHWEHRIRGELA